MNRAKPIEAGCLAILLDDVFVDGSINCQVIRKVGFDYIPGFLASEQLWKLDKFCECYDEEEEFLGVFDVACERHLMRIDDDDLQKQIESEKEEAMS